MTIITKAEITKTVTDHSRQIQEAQTEQLTARATLEKTQKKLKGLKGQLEVIDPSLVEKSRCDSNWSMIKFICNIYYSARTFYYRTKITALQGRVSHYESKKLTAEQKIQQTTETIRSANTAFSEFKKRLDDEKARLSSANEVLQSQKGDLERQVEDLALPTQKSGVPSADHYWITNLFLVPFRTLTFWRTSPSTDKVLDSEIQKQELESQIAALSAQIETNAQRIGELTIPSKSRALIESFDRCWNPATKKYEGIVYDKKVFKQHLQNHNDQFQCSFNPETDFGYIEKKDLPPGTKIFVRADLHGDLKSLMENLKTLQKQGLLDENYKCQPHVQLVFLGDYADRGAHSIQVLELLMTLRMENPTQVTLIRGNHEDIEVNCSYPVGDPNFVSFISNRENQKLLTGFYNTLPLTVYIGEESDKRRQYTQFTHGTFEVYVDPAEMLDSPQSSAQMIVPRYSPTLSLSNRIQQLAKQATPSKQQASAQKVIELWEKNKSARATHEPTVYNWGDVNRSTEFASIGMRKWTMSPEDVKHCLRAMSPHHPVKLVFRGHEHKKHHWIHNRKIVVSTMPVGMDSSGYAKRFPGQADTGYILTMAAKVKDWKKQAYERSSASSDVKVSEEVSIRDEAF